MLLLMYARVVILLHLYSLEQCLGPVFWTSIKTRNFVPFYEFLIHLGMHHTYPRCHQKPPLGKYSPRIAPEDAMVIKFGVKK
jgi:hypothetical protein